MTNANHVQSCAHHDDASSMSSIIEIDPDGDLLLHITHHDELDQLYRVSISVLRRTSAYFNVLLDPAKFHEGAASHARLGELSRHFADAATIPISELPAVTVSDVGQIPKGTICQNVIELFLNVLHNPSASCQPLDTLTIAILAIITDRFDAIPSIASFISKSSWMEDLKKQGLKGEKQRSTKESAQRQKLFIGMVLGFQNLVSRHSANLIFDGSEQWKPESMNQNENAPWWNLPHGIEGK